MIRTLSKNVSNKELIQQFADRIYELGIETDKCTYDNLECIKGIAESEDCSMDVNLYTAYYLTQLATASMTSDYSKLPKSIRKQLIKATNEGVLCVYLSSLFHMIMNFLNPMADCKIYLGYVDGTWDFSEAVPFFNLEIPSIPVKGFHSIVTIDGKVVDACYPFQFESMEKLGEIIYGDFPVEAKFYGWELNEYMPVLVNKFASYSKTSIPVYVSEHVDTMKNILDEATKKRATN